MRPSYVRFLSLFTLSSFQVAPLEMRGAERARQTLHAALRPPLHLRGGPEGTVASQTDIKAACRLCLIHDFHFMVQCRSRLDISSRPASCTRRRWTRSPGPSTSWTAPSTSRRARSASRSTPPSEDTSAFTGRWGGGRIRRGTQATSSAIKREELRAEIRSYGDTLDVD